MTRLDEMLAYLRRAQNADGSWAGGIGTAVPQIESGGAWDARARLMENTGLALLALMGNGFTPLAKEDTPERSVARGLDFLLASQHARGGFVAVPGADGEVLMHRTPTADAICTLALIEGYALGGDKRLHRAMKPALHRLLLQQISKKPAGTGAEHSTETTEPKQRDEKNAAADSAPDIFDYGGFAIAGGRRADMVAGAWVMQAFVCARSLNWNDPLLEPTLESFSAYLMRNIGGDDGPVPGALGVVPRPSPNFDWRVPQTQERSTAAGTSAAMVAGMLGGGATRYAETLRAQTAFLQGPLYLPNTTPIQGAPGSRYYQTNFTGWYMASLAMEQGGVDEGEKPWVDALYEAMFPAGGTGLYETAGADLGSFAPMGEEEQRMGRVFTAAMGALCVENAWRTRFTEK